jgi:acyl-CoA synthetase (AMP-forming)/AMP-acid ligase II
VENGDTESLIVVAEVERPFRTSAVGRAPIEAAIRRAVTEHHDARVADVCLLRPASIAKTPTGKLQRHACRARYLAGTLEAV